MNLVVSSLFVVAVGFSTAQAKSVGVKVSKTWFEQAVCTKMEVQRFEAGKPAATHSFRVSDLESIKKFILQIEKISAEGDEMRSRLDALEDEE